MHIHVCTCTLVQTVQYLNFTSNCFCVFKCVLSLKKVAENYQTLAWLQRTTLHNPNGLQIHLFCNYTVIATNLWALWVSAIKNRTFVTFDQWFSCNHTRSCQVVTYQKQNKRIHQISGLKSASHNYVRNLGSGCLGESFWNNIWVRKKTVSGRECIYKVFADKRWWLTRSGRCESWLCCLTFILNSWIIMPY